MLIGRSNLLQSVTMRPTGPHAGGAAAPAWVATDNPSPITVGSTTNTFTSVNIGTASSDRIVVIGYTSTDTVATGMTIGGVTATKDVEESSILSGLQIWHANVPTGSTGDVVVTAAGAMNNAAIVVGALTGVNATATSTNTSTAAVDPATITITVPSTGFAIVYYYGSGNAAGTWSNAIDDLRVTVVASTPLAMAHSNTIGSQTPTFTTGGGNVAHMVAAAWGP